MSGRTVRMFMADGSPFGIRQCEVFNRTIHALAVSRGRFPELKEWSEAFRPGVYFLIGKTEDGEDMVYIGEAQNGYERISQQIRDKDFWKDVILFVNKDENMHPKYLEARLINEAKVAGRYVLDNGKDQNVPMLSRADKDAMEEIIPDIRLIVAVLGHPFLDALSKPAPKPDGDTASTIGQEVSFKGPYGARGRITDEGFIILKGSFASQKFGAGNLGYESTRQRLIGDGTLAAAQNSDLLVFTRDYQASSSSQAAAIIAGGNRSGPESWEANGKTLKELEAETLAFSGAKVS